MWRLLRKALLAALLVVIVLNWTWGRLPKEPPPPAGSKYAMADGVNFHYVETPGQDPAVVMIHGHPGTSSDWNYVRAKLPGRHTIAIDRPGFGYSSGGYIPFNQQVRAIHDLTVRLGLKKPVIVGHSYGGALAIAYAEQYPKETKAIVPVDPAVDPDGINGFEKIQARVLKVLQLPIIRPIGDATFTQLIRTASAKPQVKQAFDPDPVNPEYDQLVKSISLKSSDLKTFADESLDFNGVVPQIASKYSSIRTPAWVVQGNGDKLVPAQAVKEMTAQLHNGRYLPLSGGHMQAWVHPAEVARAIESATRWTAS